MTTTPKSNFAQGLRAARQTRGLAQDAFEEVTSRVYVSALERGIKQPTLPKVDALAEVLQLHPLTLLALCYDGHGKPARARRLLAAIDLELQGLEKQNPIGPTAISGES